MNDFLAMIDERLALAEKARAPKPKRFLLICKDAMVTAGSKGVRVFYSPRLVPEQYKPKIDEIILYQGLAMDSDKQIEQLKLSARILMRSELISGVRFHHRPLGLVFWTKDCHPMFMLDWTVGVLPEFKFMTPDEGMMPLAFLRDYEEADEVVKRLNEPYTGALEHMKAIQDYIEELGNDVINQWVINNKGDD